MGILDSVIAQLRSGAQSQYDQGTGPSYGADPFAPGSVTGPAAVLKGLTSIAAAGRAKANYDAASAAAAQKAALDTQNLQSQIALHRAQAAKAQADADGGAGTPAWSQTLTVPGDQNPAIAGPADVTSGQAPTDIPREAGVEETFDDPTKYNAARLAFVRADQAGTRLAQGDKRIQQADTRLGQSGARLGLETTRTGNTLDTSAEASAKAGIKAAFEANEGKFQNSIRPYVAALHSGDEASAAHARAALGIGSDDWDKAVAAGKSGALVDASVKRLRTRWQDRQVAAAETDPNPPLAPFGQTLKAVRARRGMGAGADVSKPTAPAAPRGKTDPLGIR